MKLKLSVVSANGVNHDITLSCDVTTTVGDAAHALRRSGLFAGSNLDEFVALRRGHVTLLGSAGNTPGEQLLDPAAPIGASGLQSGWQVTVVPEFGNMAPRPIPMLGTVEVLNGPQSGAIYSLIAGINTIGRDSLSRIVLDDRSVSRRHAVIEIDRQMVLRDLSSANGTEAYGQRFEVLPIERQIEVMLGTVTLRITPMAAISSPRHDLDHRHPHTRAPRVDPRFPITKRELPKPPQPASSGRIPMLAMLAPMMMGGVLFAVTKSPMSLIMVAFTPLMMIGSWVDNLTSGKRKLKRELRQFAENLALERQELLVLREEEIRTRALETPSLGEIAYAMRARGRLLWARRPEHRGFLELRFGDGTLPSRTAVELPHRGDTGAGEWNELRTLQEDFFEVAPVPVLERLDRCGSIGVAGDSQLAAGLARALILQLAGLHSPAEVVVSAFAGSEHEGGEWEWLKWLPHIDPVTSPVAAWQLADNPKAATRLLIAIESLIERRGESGNRTVRSHIEPRKDAEGGVETVEKLPATPAVVVVVLESEIDEAHRSRLIAVAEDGPDLGIHVIWVAESIERVPAACRTFVEVAGEQSSPGQASFVRQGQTVPLHRVEYVEAHEAAALARSLAPVDDTAARALDESDLPRSVNLRELHSIDLLGGAGPILQNWHASGSIVSAWEQGDEREAVQLAAVVGQGAEGATEIDLRVHGPHALVGGTTGAGKSEFLQSWIMSLAANVSPDRLTFLLVDYKGGAAFAECVDLPHTVGLVTDLSPHLVRRALTSLRAELRYREELLAEHGAKDLITMERRGDAVAPPALVIVIDEFAALASEVPEFVDGVIDVAQRGRSLGLHLILATQRPAGVIKDNLRANTNLRVALRMADEADSFDVIGAKDAAFFDAETPGRGAVKSGAGRIAHFQTGYLGGRSADEVATARLEIRALSFVEGDAWDIADGALIDAQKRVGHRQVARDIERLRDGVIAAAETAGLTRPRKPWLEMLPTVLSLKTLRSGSSGVGPGFGSGKRGRANVQHVGAAVLIGMRDQPDAQRQDAVLLDLNEAGNVAIYGASGTGKTTALVTIAASLSESAAKESAHIFAIDAAGGGLDALLVLPTVGAVTALNDEELSRRVLRHLQDLVRERGTRFAAARANTLGSYNEVSGANEPRVLLLIDGFSAFRQATEMLGAKDEPMQVLTEIMQVGRAVGVHVVLTADRVGVLPSSLAASVQQQLVLRLASVSDYSYIDVPADTLEAAPPGRGVFAGQSDEIQLALVSDSTELHSQAQALEELALRLRSQQVPTAPAIQNAPTLVLLSELPAQLADQPVYGIEIDGFTPAPMPSSGLGVIAGPAGAGLSTAALACVTGFARWSEAGGITAECVLLSFVPDRNGGLGGKAEWDHVARGPQEVAELAKELTEALGGTLPNAPGLFVPGLIGGLIGGQIGAPVEAEAEAAPIAKARFPLTAGRSVIVVERPTEAEGTEALPMLVALAKAARRADVLVLFEFEQGAASGVWDLYSALKQPRWGLALQPDEGDGGSPFRESFGRVKRADFPAGRGFAVESGRILPVQVATV